jgi:CheY-like chemotaxis protein
LSGPRVAVLADDLIWATRLTDLVRDAGGVPIAVRSTDGLERCLGEVECVIVDLTARAYEGVAAVATAAAAGRPVLAVGQHDDHDLRRRALAAGAGRVLAYRKLHDDGPRTIAAWIGTTGTTPAVADQ